MNRKETAWICEDAHKLTKQECKIRNITMDTVDNNENICYTNEAQDIFNRYFNDLEEQYEDTNNSS